MLSFPQYGPVERFEPVIEELLASGPMQRLKRIHQLGVFHFLYPAWSTKHYEHSVGVLILLRRHGASLEEQLSGLLHDVSHMAFSHVADYLFERWDEELGDDFTHTFVTKGEVADILHRHGFNPRQIADVRQFGLLERDRPDLCADRLDYSFRDAVCFGLCSINDARRFVDDLAVVDGQFVFQTPQIAVAYARLFMDLDQKFYSSVKGIASYFLMVDAMRAALKIKLLTVDDLWRDDEHVLQKLYSAKDESIDRPLHMLMHGFEVDVDSETPAFEHRKKVRYVDPLVMHEGVLKHLSHIDPTVADEIALYLRQRKQPVRFSIVTQKAC